jgi:hypothetical protein
VYRSADCLTHHGRAGPPGKETAMLGLSLRYARYALSILGSVGFGIHFN